FFFLHGSRHHPHLHSFPTRRSSDLEIMQLHLYQMDKPLVFVLVFLTCMALIGLGIAILGLAYHHHRRHLEMVHHQHVTPAGPTIDRKSTRLNSSHLVISYAVFCLKK